MELTIWSKGLLVANTPKVWTNGMKPRPRHGSGHAHHVRLGHSGVDEPVWILLLEQIDLTLTGEIAGEAHDVIAGASQVDEGATVLLQHRRKRVAMQGDPPPLPSQQRPTREAT